jgi:hypothetical protein
MKTLADLKKHAHLYDWSLLSNSWYKEVPFFQSQYRTVARVQSSKLSLNTVKDGKLSESWIDLPKASELTMAINDDCTITLIIARVCKGCYGEPDKIHTMVYRLRPNLLKIESAA